MSVFARQQNTRWKREVKRIMIPSFVVPFMCTSADQACLYAGNPMLRFGELNFLGPLTEAVSSGTREQSQSVDS
jgi:hypothetical protein